MLSADRAERWTLNCRRPGRVLPRLLTIAAVTRPLGDSSETVFRHALRPNPSSVSDSSVRASQYWKGNLWKSLSPGRLLRSITREKAAGLLFTVCLHSSEEVAIFTTCRRQSLRCHGFPGRYSMPCLTSLNFLTCVSLPFHSEHPGECLTRTSADDIFISSRWEQDHTEICREGRYVCRRTV